MAEEQAKHTDNSTDTPDNPTAVTPVNSKVRRQRNRDAHKQASQCHGTKYPLLCFDTETTNHGELLELSVFDIDGNEVYHRYFRPHAKNWPTDIHHITPDMVAGEKRFAAYRHEISSLLNSTPFLVGCALSNDLANLRRHGVTISDRHTVIEIQNWYWLLNDNTDRHEKQQAGLSAIADRYGLGFGDEHPHSATADTRLTLDCFKSLVCHFDREYPDTAQTSADDTTQQLRHLEKRYVTAYQHAMQLFRMHNMAGYINVVKREQGYSLKYNRIPSPDNDRIVLSVPVNDRQRAESDLRNHFEPIQLKGLTGIYAMTESDFEYIRAYRNSINLETFLARQSSKKNDATVSGKVKRARQAVAAASENNADRTAARIQGSKTTRKSKKNNKSQSKTTKPRTGKSTGKATGKSRTRTARKAMRTARKGSRD